MQVGVVIIGRNEGQRLKNCVRSVYSDDYAMVYVDSGSSDDSVEFCKQQGLHVVELDTRIPFSAARARNEGMVYLFECYPDLDYVQFIDGDCEVFQGWMALACKRLAANPDLAIVCGRRKERHPQQSIYNLLCDIEWDTPIGRANACGGDFMARADALKAVDGFNPQVVAGEEPEMCYRLRHCGWQIERIDADMTLHDANMHSFSQWWRRTLRSGHAYAHNMVLHWGDDERLNVRSVLSILFWGLCVPLLFLMALLVFPAFTLVVLLVYFMMILKIAKRSAIAKDLSGKTSLLYAYYTMLGKIPQAVGVLQFGVKKLTAEEFNIIEYKK